MRVMESWDFSDLDLGQTPEEKKTPWVPIAVRDVIENPHPFRIYDNTVRIDPSRPPAKLPNVTVSDWFEHDRTDKVAKITYFKPISQELPPELFSETARGVARIYYSGAATKGVTHSSHPLWVVREQEQTRLPLDWHELGPALSKRIRVTYLDEEGAPLPYEEGKVTILIFDEEGNIQDAPKVGRVGMRSPIFFWAPGNGKSRYVMIGNAINTRAWDYERVSATPGWLVDWRMGFPDETNFNFMFRKLPKGVTQDQFEEMKAKGEVPEFAEIKPPAPKPPAPTPPPDEKKPDEQPTEFPLVPVLIIGGVLLFAVLITNLRKE